jgi:hypothetical protein
MLYAAARFAENPWNSTIQADFQNEAHRIKSMRLKNKAFNFVFPYQSILPNLHL